VSTAFGITDAGRRLSAAHAEARRAGGEGRWIAARLSDGCTDGRIYDQRADAVRHQIHETQCVYVMVQPGLMTEREASKLIEVNQRAYDAGFRFVDPNTISPILPTGDNASRLVLSQSLLGISERVR
jgi:hypothetical protein